MKGGILAIRDNKIHQKEVAKNKIPLIDMVVLNLYPFKETVAKPGVTIEEAIKQTDIGGPTNIRAAAKNYQDVTVIVDPADYSQVLNEMVENGGATTLETRKKLALKVWEMSAEYEAAIRDFWRKNM